MIVTININELRSQVNNLNSTVSNKNNLLEINSINKIMFSKIVKETRNTMKKMENYSVPDVVFTYRYKKLVFITYIEELYTIDFNNNTFKLKNNNKYLTCQHINIK